MTASESKYWGRLAEAAARARYALERDHASWHDARTTDGTPVEVKACRRRLVNGRRGRWWIEADAHDQLVANSGLYALSVYDPQTLDTGPVLATALVPASWIDQLLTWSPTGGHHKGARQAKLGWPHVLDVQEGSA